jgi:cytochrome oxidase Cu insertion factor (SCO1/SenC/PrrC family)
MLLAVSAAPIVGSYVAYYFWQPSGHVNYGELIAPRPLPDAPLATLDGKPFRLSQLKGDWVLVSVDSGACDDACLMRLVYTRQVRLATGKETERVARVWLLTDERTPDAALLAGQPDLVAVRAAGSDVLRNIAADGAPERRVYVVDPLGNLMMRYPENPDPKRMLKDLGRLLRHSQWK